MYLVIIHAGIKVTINQHWIGSDNRNKTLPNRAWWYTISYSATFKTSNCFVPSHCVHQVHICHYLRINAFYTNEWMWIYTCLYTFSLSHTLWHYRLLSHAHTNMPYFARACWNRIFQQALAKYSRLKLIHSHILQWKRRNWVVDFLNYLDHPTP